MQCVSRTCVCPPPSENKTPKSIMRNGNGKQQLKMPMRKYCRAHAPLTQQVTYDDGTGKNVYLSDICKDAGIAIRDTFQMSPCCIDCVTVINSRHVNDVDPTVERNLTMLYISYVAIYNYLLNSHLSLTIEKIVL